MGTFEQIEKELRGISEDAIILVETTADKYLEVSMASVKYLSRRNGGSGIVISVNRPYSNLASLFKQNDIDTSKMFILDCISKNLNGDAPANNVVFMDNCSSLTDLSVSISERLNNSHGKNFVFFDSITTMLIHNQPYVFARFIHSIFTKMRLQGVGGLLISIQEKTNREIRAEIAQLCDKVIKI